MTDRPTAHANVLEPETATDAREEADRGPHILLIEDDDQMRSMLAQTLEQEGYRVTECPDAFHWMDFCAGSRIDDTSIDYDLVISDIRLPGVDGLKMLEGLQHARRNPPTILITAFGDEQTHRRARELGARAVLDKPFATHDLLRVVHEHCRDEPPNRDADSPANQ